MTDKKPPQSRKLVPQKVGPLDKRRRPRGLTRAVRTAIDAIIGDRCTRDEACKRAAITERALYLALAKPEVAAHWNAAVQVLRTGERAANLFALIDVRDNSGNAMARVTAAKALELVPEHEAAARGQQMMPGLQIVIVQGAGGPPLRTIGPAPAIDVTPNEPEDEPSGQGQPAFKLPLR
jgi:hypothetical protein